jgi:SAM-dependent methyltransferase
MSRRYLNERWCVRCGKSCPTPYLKKNVKLFPSEGNVLDIGCGNGRNSEFMRSLGSYDVYSLDMVDDYEYSKEHLLGEDNFPRKIFDVFLANYVLMFLDENERQHVIDEIKRTSRVGSVLMVELYPAQDAHEYDKEELFDTFADNGWEKLRSSIDRFVVRRAE